MSLKNAMKKKSKVYSRKIQTQQKAKMIKTVSLVVLVMLLIIIAFFIGRAGRIPFFPNTGDENIASKRNAYASSNLTLTSSATQAVDGDQNTAWESNHILPASLTVRLDRQYILNKIVLKLPASWGAKREKVEILGSNDNVAFTQIVPPTIYSIAPVVTIPVSPKLYRYVRLVVSSNSQTDSAQLGEFEVYGTDPRIPWTIQSVDVMKYSKDAICNQPAATTIDTMTGFIASSGANFVAISTPYDNPTCGSSTNLTNSWITSARSKGLHIWHRHMGLSFEGIYDVTKTKDLTAYTQQIVDYILNNADQFQDGDIFTPTPEPDSAGISGVTYCPGICQFSSADEYNRWIQTTQPAVKDAFAKIDKKVQVGYYGHSGFIVWGENNPDWAGKGLLTQATVDSMDGVIAMDTYPETYGGTMVKSLDGAHARWPNARLVIGEWGTITAGNTDQKMVRITDAMTASERPYIDGINYWNLGPSGNEGLLDGKYSPLPELQTVKDFYTGLR